MFRFWTSDSRGSGKTVDGRHQLLDCADSVAHRHSGLPTPVSPKKRRRPSLVDTAVCAYPPAKRSKTEEDGDLPSPVSASADGDETGALCGSSTAPDLDAAKEAIQMQFGLEILLKHNELRLINQELAKCQVALEQLRRCHLIPYPLQCPTPGQMLHISNGDGPALLAKRGEPVPKWAPPFGVVEGPYARHYAKWLIPDPMFDGIQCEPQGLMDTGRVKNMAEGRATRSSLSDAVGLGKQRPVRGTAGQRLQALSSGYPQPKDKNTPCTVTKADGVVVKLICIDCKRWDFSSTQGFINHCRIAHRRDFKSHEEAAIASGHPIEVDERGAIVGDDHKPSAAAPSGLVHPLAHSESTSEHGEYAALLSRIQASLVLYKAGKLPGAGSPPKLSSSPRDAAGSSSQDFVGSSDVPYLSRLMQKKRLGGNLKQQVTEAKSKVDWNWPSLDADSEIDEAPTTEDSASREQPLASAVRTSAVMKMPSRATVSPSHPPAAYRAASNKGIRTTTHGANVSSPELPSTPIYDDELGMDSSPTTVMTSSNHAPSLVSDDGEYDDSDYESASETSDSMDTESISDVAEININDDGDTREATPPPVSRRHGATRAAKMKKDEGRHVTFVSPTPVPTTNKGKRKKI